MTPAGVLTWRDPIRIPILKCKKHYLFERHHAGIARTASEEAAASVADALLGLSAAISPDVLVVRIDAELQGIWDSLAAKGKPVQWQAYSGEAVEPPDGTMIGIRQTSGSGGPAIDINQPGGPQITIHIEQIRNELLDRGLADILQLSVIVGVVSMHLNKSVDDTALVKPTLEVIRDLLESGYVIAGPVASDDNGVLYIRSGIYLHRMQ